MKRQSFRLLLISLSLAIISLGSGDAMADQFSYLFPPNLSLRVADSSLDNNGRLQLSVILESALGNLSELEIYFDSSRDLKVITNLRTLKELKPQAARKVRVLAVKTGKQPDELGSWVKVGVKYTPDYNAILQAASDEVRYPDQFERQKLLEIASNNAQTKARYSEAIRFFADQAGDKK